MTSPTRPLPDPSGPMARASAFAPDLDVPGATYATLRERALNRLRTRTDNPGETLDPRLEQKRLGAASTIVDRSTKRGLNVGFAGGFVSPAAVGATLGFVDAIPYNVAVGVSLIGGILGAVVGGGLLSFVMQDRAAHSDQVRELQAGSGGVWNRRHLDRNAFKPAHCRAIRLAVAAIAEALREDIADELRSCLVEARAHLNDLVDEVDRLHEAGLTGTLRAANILDQLEDLAASSYALLQLTRERATLAVAYDSRLSETGELTSSLRRVGEMVESENATVRTALAP